MIGTVKDRVIAFIQSTNLTVKGFERKAGLSNGAVSKMGNSPRSVIVEKIIDAFPNLNRDWLLTGEGEMLNSDTPPAATRAENLIPFYDAETSGGYNGRVGDSTADAPLAGYISAGGWFDGRETAAIRHIGDSMLEYPDGCILVVREVHDRHLLIPGRVYVIETSEYRVTKRLQKGHSPEYIALYSSNPEKYEDGRLVYEPFEVATDDIRRIYSILGYIVNQHGAYNLIRP